MTADFDHLSLILEKIRMAIQEIKQKGDREKIQMELMKFTKEMDSLAVLNDYLEDADTDFGTYVEENSVNPREEKRNLLKLRNDKGKNAIKSIIRNNSSAEKIITACKERARKDVELLTVPKNQYSSSKEKNNSDDDDDNDQNGENPGSGSGSGPGPGPGSDPDPPSSFLVPLPLQAVGVASPIESKAPQQQGQTHKTQTLPLVETL